MEDPASMLSRLAAELKAMGYESFTTPWDPTPGGSGPVNALKLRSGHGEAVVRVLLFLAEKALEMRGWRPQRPRWNDDA